jgi:SAM-dependent methyltransferase
MTTTYAYDNSHDTATHQHDVLSRLLDPVTIDRLGSLVGDLSGKRCLVVGAGSGSLPGYLAGRVGPVGGVTATDIDTSLLAERPGLAVVEHDITSGPPPNGPYDVICARLVLMHLPSRVEVLGRLAEALVPGGLLLVEDWHLTAADAILDAPDERAFDVYRRYQEAVIANLTGFGTDPTWATRARRCMREAGLVRLDTHIDAKVWTHDNYGLALTRVTANQHRDRLMARGLSEEDIAEVLRLVTQPDSGLVVRGHQLYSNAGFRSGGQQ